VGGEQLAQTHGAPDASQRVAAEPRAAKAEIAAARGFSRTFERKA